MSQTLLASVGYEERKRREASDAEDLGAIVHENRGGLRESPGFALRGFVDSVDNSTTRCESCEGRALCQREGKRVTWTQTQNMFGRLETVRVTTNCKFRYQDLSFRFCI